MKKHIVCFGDSNTHGYCAVPSDCEDGGNRFSEAQRWTCLLQQLLGDKYLVLEEGLSGRTTVFPDPLVEGLDGVSLITPILMSHEPVDLLVIMLGTNDVKERFSANPYCIGLGLERLILKAKNTPCWGEKGPNILVICPPAIETCMKNHPCVGDMGLEAIPKSRMLCVYYQDVCTRQGCAFLDGQGLGEFNQCDGMHLTAAGHRSLARALAEKLPELLED